MASSEILERLSSLETQLNHTSEKVKMRENVIQQLEEEIQAKERLIYEQGHLINILEKEQAEMKFDAESINSDSEITIIDRHCTSSSPTKSHSPVQDENERYRERLEQALVDRERLELQNEQLLKQWEEALEYVSKVQKQLQEELRRNTSLKTDRIDMEKYSNDCIVITRGAFQILAVCAVFFAYYLYSL